MSGKELTAPDSSLSDGYFQLQYLHENASCKLSKWKVMKFLFGLSSGKHCKLKYVGMAPTQAYRFEPLKNTNGENKGIIAIDGEVVEYTRLQMENLRAFLTVYGPRES